MVIIQFEEDNFSVVENDPFFNQNPAHILSAFLLHSQY
jgi:hypothetical protein